MFCKLTQTVQRSFTKSILNGGLLTTTGNMANLFSTSKDQLKNTNNEKLVPVSPLLGPYSVANPIVKEKKYFWCTCGLSATQPFCDGKHKGTGFSPFKFTVEEAVESINLCGCKLTTSVPYCDEKTCKCLNK